MLKLPLPALTACATTMIALVVVAARPGQGAPATMVPVGAGSYSLARPAGAAGPPSEIYRTEAVKGPMPTNRWWSSLAWMPFSDRQYPHPLAVQATAAGLRIHYPGPEITANSAGVFGAMPAPQGEDILLTHSGGPEFPDARVDGHSDWFVSARFEKEGRRMTVAYGHGSPYVYALFNGGGARLRLGAVPRVWSGSETSPILGVTIKGHHYGLFGPSGSRWSGLVTAELTNQAAGKPYFSLAALPDDAPATLALFAKYAHAHVRDTRAEWRYDEPTATLTTTYSFTTHANEGTEKGTLFALYPHQWLHSRAPVTSHAYASVRGTMKLAAGSSFTTEMKFTGVLPSLPGTGTGDREQLQRYIAEALAKPEAGIRDTYWEGKRLGKLATLASMSDVIGKAPVQAAFDEMRSRLENWFSAGKEGAPDRTGLFAYDANWGTLIGYPASFGSDNELNDHHFHYGYFIKAAAELARHDPQWADEKRWGGFVRFLIRDIASADRSDPFFPFLRNFDAYAGHTWASGHARFGDGNNNEASSEAMNAWTGLILWGETTGDRAVRDLGIYLYTTELAAIENYWFDVEARNRPKAFPGATVAMVWGGKSVPATWFSGEPEKVHGINWLPFQAGSLYLGRYPEYAARNYDALAKATARGPATDDKPPRWGSWASYVLAYRGLSDPADALRQFADDPDALPIEEGMSRANLFQWLRVLNQYGQVDRSITADTALYAVLRKDGKRSHIAANLGTRLRTVRFSDGVSMTVDPGKVQVAP